MSFADAIDLSGRCLGTNFQRDLKSLMTHTPHIQGVPSAQQFLVCLTNRKFAIKIRIKEKR